MFCLSLSHLNCAGGLRRINYFQERSLIAWICMQLLLAAGTEVAELTTLSQKSNPILVITWFRNSCRLQPDIISAFANQAAFTSRIFLSRCRICIAKSAKYSSLSGSLWQLKYCWKLAVMTPIIQTTKVVDVEVWRHGKQREDDKMTEKNDYNDY